MSKQQETILLVDDDRGHRTMLKANLEKSGYSVVEVSDGDEVLAAIGKHNIDVILLDLKMSRVDGLTTLAVLLQAGCTIPVIVITAFSSVESAVEAMKKGAFDYITKPVDVDELLVTLSRALSFRLPEREGELGETQYREKLSGFDNIIGQSPAMQAVFADLSMVAPTDATILITGESGTGKELIAAAVHEHINPADK